MTGLGTELRGLVASVLSGMTAACAYACIHNLRKVIRHTKRAVDIEDAGYCIWVALYLFGQLYDISSGVIRWYVVLGVASGITVFCMAGRCIRKRVNTYVRKREKNSPKTIEIDHKKR